MDARQQNHDFSGTATPRGLQETAYGGGHNEQFNSFIHTDPDPSYDPPWNAQPFANHQQSVNGFSDGGNGGNGWQQPPYQTPSTLPMSNYTSPSPNFDQTYSRAPAFNYNNFDINPTPSTFPGLYDTEIDYNSASLSNDARFDYSRQQEQNFQNHHETISPQALQTYSDFSRTSYEDVRQSSSPRYESTASARKGSTDGSSVVMPLTPQEWSNRSSRKVNSIARGGLQIKPTESFQNATNSSRFDGFIFVGKSNVPLSISKASIPRYRRKKSRNETMRLLQIEKGDEAWHRDREPLVKRLKIAASKQAGPVHIAIGVPKRSSSTVDSASSSDSSDSDSDGGSDYYSESEGDVEPEEVSPLPASRPADPSKAIEYDLIKVLWAKKNSLLSAPAIRTALSDCWNLFKGVRDKWKMKSTALQQAIEKKDQTNKTTYERRVVEQRRLLENCIQLTLKHGHPSIVEKLCENPTFLLIFYTFLADRVKENDYSDSLITSILELINRCPSVDTTLLEKTKLDKILPRLVKRGSEESKKLAQRLLDNSKLVAKQKAGGEPSASKPQPDGASLGKASAKEKTSSSEFGEIKASRPGEAKIAANEAAKALNVKAEAKPVSKVASGDAGIAKNKVTHVPARPSGFFSSLQSASKKPGTSTKQKDGKISIQSENKSEIVVTAPKPAFSFAATMADLAKQKEAPPMKSEETRKAETPEEKKKRIRKEQRRKLRVSFKSDEDLVQIREFMHDPEEELGHEDSQVRDVGDSKGEGQMLKMHKELDIDDEEEYEPPEEVLPETWIVPKPIDFSDIDESERKRNIVSRGGEVEISSQEREMQEQRELSTLLAFYASPADIPPSPREPAEAPDDHTIEQSFGTPDELVKARETEYYARKNAPTTSPTADISALLRIMNSQLQPSQPPALQPPAPSNHPTGLEAIFAAFSQTNQQSSQPQIPQQPPPPVSFNLQAALQHMTQPNQSPTYQSQSAYAATQSGQAPDLQTILSQFGQRAPQAPPMQGFTYNSNPYPGDNDRKRQFENDDQDEDGFGKGKKKRPYTGSNVKTLPCRFWQEGKCRKGDACTYLHD